MDEEIWEIAKFLNNSFESYFSKEDNNSKLIYI